MKVLLALLLWVSLSVNATPILVYHHVRAAEASDLSITQERFEEQVAWLQSEGYAFKTVRNLPTTEKAVVLTFDDGWRDNLPALQHLKDRGLTATLFPLTGIDWDGYLSLRELRELSDDFEIGSHTHTHFLSIIDNPTSIDDLEVVWELVLSKELLERATGKPVTSLSWPFGIIQRNVLPLLPNLGFRDSVNVSTEATERLNTLDRLTVDGRCSLEEFKRMVLTQTQVFCR